METDSDVAAARREFLKKCGKFMIVTPPAVSLMLSAAGSNFAVAGSGFVSISHHGPSGYGGGGGGGGFTDSPGSGGGGGGRSEFAGGGGGGDTVACNSSDEYSPSYGRKNDESMRCRIEATRHPKRKVQSALRAQAVKKTKGAVGLSEAGKVPQTSMLTQ